MAKKKIELLDTDGRRHNVYVGEGGMRNSKALTANKAAVCAGLGWLLTILLTGCGGGEGGGVGASGNPFAGTYSANYTRSPVSGTLTIAVGADGSVTVVITDSQAGVFRGNGTVSNTGELTATATNQATQGSATVTGLFVKQGGIITASGSIAGSISVSRWAASKIAEVGMNAFAGNWSGTYAGSESGTWSAAIGTDGNVSATAQSPSVGTVTLRGTVSSAGWGTLSGSGTGQGGPFTITWEGTFYLQGNEAVASGTWRSSSGFSGDWRGQRASR
jgi:hypothetical protein